MNDLENLPLSQQEELLIMVGRQRFAQELEGRLYGTPYIPERNNNDQPD